MLEFKKVTIDRVDIYDEGVVFVASIYAHEKNITIISKYLDKAKPDERIPKNLVRTDLKTVPAVDIDFFI